MSVTQGDSFIIRSLNSWLSLIDQIVQLT